MEKNFIVEAEKAVISKTKSFEINGQKVSLDKAEKFMEFFNMLSHVGKNRVSALPLENQLALADTVKLFDPEFDPTKTKGKK